MYRIKTTINVSGFSVYGWGTYNKDRAQIICNELNDSDPYRTSIIDKIKE